MQQPKSKNVKNQSSSLNRPKSQVKPYSKMTEEEKQQSYYKMAEDNMDIKFKQSKIDERFKKANVQL